jgi:outer membrane receptor protein involved in Fe transport
MNRRLFSSVALVLCLVASLAHAQGVQTGTLTGKLKSSDGVALPDAAIAITSNALQGERTATSDINGVYLLANLPPGTYMVKISKAGLADVERSATVPLGGTATINATLSLANISESVVVEGAAPPPVTEIQTSANILASDINLLPMGRTPYLAAELMPGVTTNTPNGNQITISGGFAYDNVFLIDGVDVNDNLLGTSNDLFIEDAIGEVQVLTSGVSAEYGRFSGGVVNIITKSGGNKVSGSYRTNFTRPAWAQETPFERANGIQHGKPTEANPFITNKLSTFTELSGGGPAVKDRLWFFGAGRFENSSTAGTLQQTAIPYTKTNHGKRYEVKGTGSLAAGHTLQGTFIDNRVHRGNEPVLSFSIDKATFISPSTPNRLGVVSYAGALSPRMLVSAQYSQKDFATEGVGSTATAIVDSPFLTRTGTQFQYNAPLFDASDPEQRNNKQVTASLTHFLSDRKFGSHELKGGFEDFVDTRIGANSQTSTGYVFQSNFKVDAAGIPVLDAEGRAIPVFTTGTSRLQRWFPHRGAEFNMTTLSAYAQDRWVANPHVTFNLGMRYEHASSNASAGGSTDVDVNRIVPRLGASYDVNADGKTVVLGTYAQYSGKYNDTQFSRNTLVGNSERYTTVYTGPNGEGRDFAAGFDPANYAGAVVAASFPTLNVLFDKNLSSPLTHEFTVGAARTLGASSYVKGVYVQRKTTNFVEDYSQIANGISNIVVNGVTVGTTDNILYKNSDLPKRTYSALEFLGQHRVMNTITVNGQWTVQLKNDGNFEGESPNPTGSALGDYPEMLVMARSAPEGRLDDFQRHKVRVWAHYDLGLGQYGSLDMTPLVRYNSGRTYSLAANGLALSAIQAARNPGYANTVTQTLFFAPRGSESFKGYGLLDLALTYEVPVWKSARPWIKFESFNLLNNQKLISWDSTITADANSTKDENGLPTGYLKGARFGTATANSNYPGPRAGLDGGRTLDFSVGFRF